MPAADPVRERILAAAATRFAAITAGSIYWMTPAEVVRDWKNFDEAKASYDAAADLPKPTYSVIEGVEDGADLSNKDVHETFTVIVTGWIKATKNRRTWLNRAIGDIKVSIFTDETWGGLAQWTDVTKTVTDEAAFQNNAFAYFELTMQVHYDRARTAV